MGGEIRGGTGSGGGVMREIGAIWYMGVPTQ